MAKYIPGLLVGDIRGKVGNMVFRKNSSSNYFAVKTIPVNPNTVAQQLVRARFGQSSQEWSNLTQAERDAWIETSPSWTRTNIFNLPNDYTGFALFMRLSRFLQEINEAINPTASLPGSVTSLTTLAVTADTGGGTLTVAFTPAIPVTQKSEVFATQPLSVGVRFVRNQFRKIAVVDSTFVSGADLAAFYIAKFGALPPVGSKVFVEILPVVITNGQPGVALKDDDIAI